MKRLLMSETKKCGRCRQHLPLSVFGKNRSMKDGLCGYCQTCRSLYRAIPENRRKEKRYSRVYMSMPEHKERAKLIRRKRLSIPKNKKEYLKRVRVQQSKRWKLLPEKQRKVNR